MARSRVELCEQIRRDRRVEKLSIRELADRHHVHRRTVRQALANAIPPPRKKYLRRQRPAIDPYAESIDSWLLADREVPRKQRHTARRVWQRLVAEHGATMAEVTVSRYVARRKSELGLDRVEVAVPQTHAPGAEAEVERMSRCVWLVPPRQRIHSPSGLPYRRRRHWAHRGSRGPAPAASSQQPEDQGISPNWVSIPVASKCACSSVIRSSGPSVQKMPMSTAKGPELAEKLRLYLQEREAGTATQIAACRGG